MKSRVLVGLAGILVAVIFAGDAAGQDRELVDSGERRFGQSVSYLGEMAVDGEILLDANNGFFDRSFVAKGKRAATAADKKLISSHFSHLANRTAEADGSARWHVWFAKLGAVQVRLQMEIPEAERRIRWQVVIDGETQTIMPAKSGKLQSLEFTISKIGKHTIAFRKLDSRLTPKTKLNGIHLFGPAVEGAKLLRARWRPAAVHTQYKCSNCPATNLWVFESQSGSEQSSYSPMTTPFGYFGASFTRDAVAAGNLNFSMWAASRKAKEAPPLSAMPHLLATGNPEADFSGFGHEGSGVKIRNWEPFQHHPKSVIQALRLESSEDFDTYYGYWFDERSERWVLFAAGRKPKKVSQEKNENQSKRNSRKDGGLRASSFCEIPGPPQVERSGDQRRIIRRRGWFLGPSGSWHRVDQQTVSIRKSEGPVNKFIGVDDGWFLMGTGGMEMVTAGKEVKLTAMESELPKYLKKSVAKQLFELPVRIGASQVDSIQANSAKVQYEIFKSGGDVRATLYYGPVDCIAFAPRSLHGTEKKGLSAAMQATDRTWADSVEGRVAKGVAQFQLNNLKPRTKYFFRVLVSSDQGKSWAFESGSFTTR